MIHVIDIVISRHYYLSRWCIG